jgi:hypothetical protein
MASLHPVSSMSRIHLNYVDNPGCNERFQISEEDKRINQQRSISFLSTIGLASD